MEKLRLVEDIVILHGWGISGERYSNLKSILETDGYRVFNPDFPGFGKNDLAKESLTLPDYTQFLKDYLEEKKIKNCVLIGHSFGSRVLVEFLFQHQDLAKEKFGLRGVVLTGAPLIKHKLTFRKKFWVGVAKVGKGLLRTFSGPGERNDFLRKVIYRLIGETDYYRAGKMRKTFLNVINFELESKLSRISVPTLILWGKEDRVTPYQDALKICDKINGSRLVGIAGATHKLPYENPMVFAQSLTAFFKEI
jgi:pimeloyl-ACP methyl ester carboxylesterase